MHMEYIGKQRNQDGRKEDGNRRRKGIAECFGKKASLHAFKRWFHLQDERRDADSEGADQRKMNRQEWIFLMADDRIKHCQQY